MNRLQIEKFEATLLVVWLWAVLIGFIVLMLWVFFD